MNAHDPVAAPNDTPRPRRRTSRRVRQARTFLVIAVMAALVSVAGHCFTGDDTPTQADTAAEVSSR